MRYQVSLLQGFQIDDQKADASPGLRKYKSIIALLAFLDRPVSRAEIAEKVWGGVEEKAARNRLRVALTKFRSLLPGALVESKRHLSLNKKLVTCDAWRISELVQMSVDSVTPTEELTILRPLFDYIAEPALLDLSLPGASGFFMRIAPTCVRVFELEKEANSIGRAMHAIRLATFLDPSNPKVWSSYLRFGVEIGNSLEVAKDFHARAEPAILADVELRTISDVAESDRLLSGDSASDLDSLWASSMPILREKRPDIMRMILASAEMLPACGKHPRLMHDLMEEAFSLSVEPKDELWQKGFARMVGLKAWLGEAQGVIDLAPVLIEMSEDIGILRASYNSLAVGHSLLQQWPEAHDALNRSEEFAEKMEHRAYVLSAQGNRAYFLMQQGEFSESDRTYEKLTKELEESEASNAKFELAVALGNWALIPVFQSQWVKAQKMLDRAINVREHLGTEVQHGILLAALALTNTYRGSSESTFNLVRMSLLDAFKNESLRAQLFTFDMICRVFYALGEVSYARSLFRWVTDWRAAAGVPRNKSEEVLTECLKDSKFAAKVGGDPPAVAREVQKVLRSFLERSL